MSNDVLTPHQVESKLRAVINAMDEAVDSLHDLSIEAAEAEVDHKVAWAKELLTAVGPMDVRKATAEVACEVLFRRRRIAEAVRDACQERNRSLRSELSALQSLAANVRELARP